MKRQERQASHARVAVDSPPWTELGWKRPYSQLQAVHPTESARSIAANYCFPCAKQQVLKSHL